MNLPGRLRLIFNYDDSLDALRTTSWLAASPNAGVQFLKLRTQNDYGSWNG